MWSMSWVRTSFSSPFRCLWSSVPSPWERSLQLMSFPNFRHVWPPSNAECENSWEKRNKQNYARRLNILTFKVVVFVIKNAFAFIYHLMSSLIVSFMKNVDIFFNSDATSLRYFLRETSLVPTLGSFQCQIKIL